MTSDCYSLRRLCPYLGTVQVVETALDRGISVDGRSWQSQVRTRRPSDLWGSINRDTPGDATLVDEYLDWLAPRLPVAVREHLEQTAMRQALQVETYWLLYPEIIHADHLNVARVEARLRRAGER